MYNYDTIGCSVYTYIITSIDQPTVNVESEVVKLEHTSFNLTCTAIIDPNSPNNLTSLVWRNNNGNILASYSSKLAVLNITNALRNMSGQYECIASDGTHNYTGTTSLFIQCE